MLMLRGIALCVACEVMYRVIGGRQNLLVLLVVLVYGDAYMWRRHQINRVAGFLCPVALCILTSTDHTLCSPVVRDWDGKLSAMTVYWTLQVVWPLTTAYYFCSIIFKFKRPREVVLVLVWAVCLNVHCFLLLGGLQKTGEIMLRSMIYYMSATLFYHSKCRLPDVDRNTHNFVTMHMCLHLMFVDVYMLTASVVVFGALFWYLFFGSLKTEAAAVCTPHKIRHTPVVQDDELLSQLRAAKANTTRCAV